MKNMSRKILHCDNIGACQICGNSIEKQHPWYYCSENNDNFGNINYPKECDDYIELEEDELEEYNNFFDPTKSVECPYCGSDAYWGGSNYECDQCGWCGMPDE